MKDLKNIYRGVGGEYFLIGSLYRLGYDALKLPIDFGFDVMGFKTDNNQQNRPFYFQVSTRKLKAIEASENCNEEKDGKSKSSSSRTALRTTIKISKTQFLKLCEEERSALICYLYDDSDENPNIVNNEEMPFLYFWLSSANLRKLKEFHDKNHNVFYEGDDYCKDPNYRFLNIKVTYRDPDNSNTHYYVTIVDDKFTRINDLDGYLGICSQDDKVYANHKIDSNDHYKLGAFLEYLDKISK